MAQMQPLNISLAQFLAVSFEAVIVFDQNGDIFEFNPAAEKIFGFTRDEIVGKSVFDYLIPSQFYETAKQNLSRSDFPIGTEFQQRFETVGIRKDESEVPIELGFSVVQVENMNYRVAFVRDISQRKMTDKIIRANEETLERNRERVEAILNNSTDAILLISEYFKIRQANSAFTKMFGYEVDDMFDQTIDILVDPNETEKLAITFINLVYEGKPQFAEFSARRKDGRVFHADFGISPIQRKNSPDMGIVCNIRDITELRNTQKEIAEERNLLRTLIDLIPDYIYIKDTHHRFLLSNITHARARGFSRPDDIIGKSDADFFPAELAQEFRNEEQVIFQTGTPMLEHEQASAGYAGGYKWGLSTKLPLRNLSGELVGLVGITRDITERKTILQQESQMARNLRAVVEATDELLNLGDTDSIYRRAVELAREKLRIERCAIFLLDETGQFLVGTYGTDENNATSDEHSVRIPVSKNPELLTRFDDPWWVTHNGVLTTWKEDTVNSIGHGWIATTIIRSGDEPIGIFSNDAAISGSPLDPVQQESLAVFCSLLGNLLRRKHTEENLQTATSRLSNLIENLDAGILLENERRQIAVINQTFCDMFSIPVPAEMLIGTDCSGSAEQSKSLFAKPNQFVERIDEVLRKREKVLSEELQLADGRQFLRDYVPIVLKGRYLGHLWQYRDATEMFRARLRQQRLMELEQLLRKTTDIYLHEDNIAASMSQVLALVGQTIDVSRTYIAHFRKNVRLMDTVYEWCAANVTPEINNNQAVPYEDLFPSLHPMLTQDGVIAPSHINELPDDMRTILQIRGFQTVMILPVYVSGRLDGLVGLAEYRHGRNWLPEEISAVRTVAEGYSHLLERKQSEQSLVEARDAALKTAQVKSEFMSNMSHEIRTPMTGVLGMLELLLETDLDETQHEFAQDANNSAKRLLNIINDILDFSKIEAGQMVLQTEPIDLRGMVREVITTVSPLVKSKSVVLVSQVDPQVPYRIIGDSTRLSQILINLVANAVKFTKVGNVTIRLSVIAHMGWNVRLRFEVQDTGIGIPDNQINRIFESFVQADGTSTRKYGGTGLGLAICKQLVELMGGEIDVQSKVGEGSSFRFVLSLPYIEKTEDYLEQSSMSQLKVMIVDEDKTSRFMISQQLRIWGIQIVEVSRTSEFEQAVHDALLQEDNFALMLIHAPLSMAEAMASYLRNNVPSHIVKLLVRVDDIEHPFTSGASAFDVRLIRPFQPSDLYNLVIRVADLPITDWNETYPDQLNAVEVKILVVEDNEVNQRIMTRVLHSSHFMVDVVKNGQDALYRLESHTYDIVLMDIHMPIMDGKTATKLIRNSQQAFRDIPIVAVTASALPDECADYLAIGMNDVIAKPFSLDQLRAMITKWVKPQGVS